MGKYIYGLRSTFSCTNYDQKQNAFKSDLTNVFQVFDVISLCAHDLIDDVGSHLFFAG